MTDQGAERLAETMNRLAAALEQHLTPRPIRRNRRRRERTEIDHWINHDRLPDDRNGGGC